MHLWSMAQPKTLLNNRWEAPPLSTCCACGLPVNGSDRGVFARINDGAGEHKVLTTRPSQSTRNLPQGTSYGVPALRFEKGAWTPDWAVPKAA